MNINSFKIDTTQMASVETAREFVVTGDIGAEFQIIALNNPASSSDHTTYYDFETNSFESGHNDLNNNLIVTLSSNSYRNNISFPSGIGNYVIKLITLNGTSIKGSSTGVLSREISKVASTTTVTFSPATSNSGSYETFPTTQSTGALGSSAYASINWDVTNRLHDDNGYGLTRNSTSVFKFDLLRKQSEIFPNVSRAFYYQTTIDVKETATASNKIEVSSLANVTELMSIVGVSAGSLSGEPIIEKIDSDNMVIFLSSPQTFSQGITLTLRAYGTKLIYRATDLKFDIGGGIISVPDTGLVTKKIRGTVSNSTTITVDNTYGLFGGSTIDWGGAGASFTANGNKVVSVVADADGSGANGSFTANANQSLTAGTKLYFKHPSGLATLVNFAIKCKIISFPSSNLTIYFDLDKFLTPGVSGL